MKSTRLLVAAIALGSLHTLPSAQAASYASTVLRFSTMFGVDGPFAGDENPIRGVPGDDLPWTVRHVDGTLSSDGDVNIVVEGLVFTNDPEVPVKLRGINDEKEFRAIVSCLTSQGDTVATTNVSTPGFTATRTGNAHINARVKLPSPCVAPVVFIVAADEDDWLAVTGVKGY